MLEKYFEREKEKVDKLVEEVAKEHNVSKNYLLAVFHHNGIGDVYSFYEAKKQEFEKGWEEAWKARTFLRLPLDPSSTLRRILDNSLDLALYQAKVEAGDGDIW